MADATRALPVPAGLAGMRVDAGLARLLGLSRTTVAALVEAGRVQLDGRPAGKSDRLAGGAWLEVELPDTAPAPTPVADQVGADRTADGLVVLHEDADLVVVDKTVGVAAHASPGWTGPTVLGGLAARGVAVATSGAAERQGVVHRLDVGTTGVMVVAKSEPAYTALKRAFRERTVQKDYHAVVQGHPDPTRGTVDAPIDRHPRHDYRFAVVADGRPAVTQYDTLEAFRAATLLDVRPQTGRTHQIRVHLAALRHPCVGDLTYGADPVLARRLGMQRQWLHARSLGFAHPADGRWVQFTSPYPADLQHALDVLRDAA